MQTCTDLNADTTVPSTSSQLLLVNGDSSSNALVTMCQKDSNDEWFAMSHDYPVVVGTNGIAQPGEKVEGDNKTPSGTFTVGPLFGFYPVNNDPVSKQYAMDYRYIVDSKDANGFFWDKFIDDASHPLYNQWVSGPTDATSFEQMRISPYRYGFVINYNMYPSIVAGKGSAIFFHLQTTGSNSTAGCVATDKDTLVVINQWFSKDSQPLIRIVAN